MRTLLSNHKMYPCAHICRKDNEFSDEVTFAVQLHKVIYTTEILVISKTWRW